MRVTQEDAYEDFKTRRGAGGRTFTARDLTTKAALEAVVKDAQERGLPVKTVKGAYQAFVNALLRYFTPEAPLASIEVGHVKEFIRRALHDGRKPITVREKDLGVLSLAFQLAKISNPVPEARQAMRHALKGTPVEMPYLLPEEIAHIIDQVRHGDFPHMNQERRRISRQRHADIIELLASTGIRAGEASRLTVEDIDFSRGLIHIRQAKDRTNPRAAPITPNLEEPLRRLVERAREHPERRLIHSMQDISYNLARWAKKLGEPRLHARALRHSFGTALAANNVPLPTIMALMGHRRIATTSRYVHALKEGRHDAAASVTAAFQTKPGEDSEGPPRRRPG